MARPWLFKLLRVRGGNQRKWGAGRVRMRLPSPGSGPGSSCSFPGCPGSFVCDPPVTDKEAEARVRKVLSPVTQLLVQRGRTVWPRPPILCPPFICGKTLPKE